MGYLDSIFHLAGLAPSLVSSSEREDIERRVGAALPEAFAELVYSDAWPTLLRLGSDDQPHARDELGEPITAYGEAYSGLADGLLPFMSETQGVCTWALPLHEGPDPRVLVEVDTMPTPDWQLACESFSVWLRCRVEDGLMDGRIVYCAQAPPLSEEMLADLRDAFTEGPRTYAWPGKTNHRFRGPAVDLLLWAADDQCDWFVAPKRDFDVALRSIPRIELIVDALYPLTDDGEPALAAIRTEHGSDA